MIEIELPGFEKSNVSLDVKGKTLHILAKRMVRNYGAQIVTGEQSGKVSQEDESVESSKESAEGETVEVEYAVRFNVDKRAGAELISASMKDGLLKVVVPAKAPEEPQVRIISLEKGRLCPDLFSRAQMI